MDKNTQKLIAIDLDGTTLLSDGKTISRYTKYVFKRIEELGHIICISTGRPFRMSLDIYRELELKSPMINFNGALISKPDNRNWEHTKGHYIDRSFVFDFLRHQQNFDLEFFAVEYRRKFFLNSFRNVEPKLFGVDKFHPYNRLRADRLDDNPHAVLLSTRVKDKFRLAKQIQDHYNGKVNVSGWGGPNGILEIVPKGVSKASGLKHLLKVLDIPRENLIAFGDEHNDIEMFKLAEEAYAMKNASYRLIPYATEIIPWTNDEDGVAGKLEELFLK
ncbi:Cof-type HAD-IIB family hydrolase [Lactococcus garvieae]|uniref:Cof protein, HD superfamily hydrolase n=1 Tax=Lactococcus garvieae DCC43 TaxID=1231377 RepID=K2QEG8_9LACT|nr:Cof-type HAD-IIB family hydrolase [Lactococcus garvieae]EKF51817.1 Cof protein, HD superfamily hydrolase [Lactococcus garvieae DCC43]